MISEVGVPSFNASYTVDRLIRFTSVGIKTIREVVPFIKPLIDERKQKMEELGDGWTDKPVGRG